jgi:hypothetical protein
MVFDSQTKTIYLILQGQRGTQTFLMPNSGGDESRRTAAPVATMEEMSVLSEQEREELLTSLKEAEACAAAGQAADYDPATFKDRLIGISITAAPSRSHA